MIDTMQLCLSNWEVADNSRVTIKPSPMDYGTGELTADFPLWSSSKGKEIRGAGAYFNNDDLQVDVRAYVYGAPQCFVKFSIPKIHNGENYYSVGRDGTQAVLNRVEGELYEAGIKADIEQASISRIDTFKNVITEEPFMAYSPLFSLLKASRRLRRDYGTSFLWSNTQQELSIYDKLVEMEAKAKKEKKEIDITKFPAQTMRFEYRLKNRKKVHNILGFSKVGELPKNWDEIKHKFINVWEKDIFNKEVADINVIASKQIIKELLSFYELNNRNYVAEYLKAVGAHTIEREQGLEALRLAIREVEREKNSKRTTALNKEIRTLEKVEEYSSLIRLFRKDKEPTTLKDLYKELQEKVCLN